VWSVTSYQQLRNEALQCEHDNLLNPDKPERIPYLTQALAGVPGPFIAVSDHMKLLADFVARWIPGRFLPLGTEGFGLSDTRTALRRHFEIDAESIVCASLYALQREGLIEVSLQREAMDTFGISSEKTNPMNV